MMKYLFRCALVYLLMAGSSHAGCPIGTHEWIDGWGNKICKSSNIGGTRSIQGRTRNCPVGTHAWLDSRGKAICRSSQGYQKNNNTSKLCPTGSYKSIDKWGNSICKKY